jgi:uncharacterized protein DUF2071
MPPTRRQALSNKTRLSRYTRIGASMRLPTISGIIRRRILVNYRADPEVIQPLLPSRFRPKLHSDHAVAGVCLIRLEYIRPKNLPEIVGISSENAAHRIAVVWDDEMGITREGVFIPRRDTDSALNHFLGGRVFPGEYNLATFKVTESSSQIDLSMRSHDGTVALEVRGSAHSSLPESSIFRSVSDASAFFEGGSLGYSARSRSEQLDAIELETKDWRVEPLNLNRVYSSYFADEKRFPKGSVEFDHTLIMRNIAHEWHVAS